MQTHPVAQSTRVDSTAEPVSPVSLYVTHRQLKDMVCAWHYETDLICRSGNNTIMYLLAMGPLTAFLLTKT